MQSPYFIDERLSATSFSTSSSGLFREKPWGRGCLVPRVLSFHPFEDLGNKVSVVSRDFCNEFFRSPTVFTVLASKSCGTRTTVFFFCETGLACCVVTAGTVDTGTLQIQEGNRIKIFRVQVPSGVNRLCF